MSSYIHIFAYYSNMFTPLTSYSRSCVLYHVLRRFAPYGKIAPLMAEQLQDALADLTGEYEALIQRTLDDENTIAALGSWTGSVDERLEAMYKLRNCIKERQLQIEEYDAAIWTLKVMMNFDALLYIGEECGCDMTVDDVVECS